MDKENVVHIHNGVLAAEKNNDIMKFAGKWMKLENVILSEICELGSPSPFLVRYIRRKAGVKAAAAQHQYGATVILSISPSLSGFNSAAVRGTAIGGSTEIQKAGPDRRDRLAEASPWFITGGGLNIPDWEQVKVDLQKILRKKGTDKVLLATFSIWCLIKDALLTDKVKVKEQLVEAEQSLEKIQEKEVRKSVSATDTQSEDEEESQFETKAQEVKVKVKEFSLSSSSERDSEEEERLEQEIVDLKKKLEKC
ncbi:hypothetical protein STEG23_037832 [Scotinomys teguina]